MDLSFYDRNIQLIEVLDVYQSALWIEKFRGEGTLELKTELSKDLLDLVSAATWIGMPHSSNLMEINKSAGESHVEKGDILTIKGVTLESILSKRIVFAPVNFSGTVDAVVRSLINNNFVAPTEAARKVSELSMPAHFSSKKSLTNTVKTSRKRLPVQDILEDFIWSAQIGYSIRMNASRTGFVFDLYDGNDFTSTDSPGYVEFSREFDNLSNVSFAESDETRFTRGYLAGKIGQTDVTVTLDKGAAGLEMRETFIDGSQVESKNPSGTDMTSAAYKAALVAYGQKQYALNYTTREFSCEVDPYLGFEYGVDYALGDIVFVRDQFGYSEKSRVIEVAYSADTSKVTVVPTFAPDIDHTITAQQ